MNMCLSVSYKENKRQSSSLHRVLSGGLYDSDTKLIRFGARDYDPTIGRWTTKDPIGFAGGDTNLYAYVGGNPMSYNDPQGTNPFVIGGAVVGGFIGAFFGGYEARNCSAGQMLASIAAGAAGGAIGGAVLGLTGGAVAPSLISTIGGVGIDGLAPRLVETHQLSGGLC